MNVIISRHSGRFAAPRADALRGSRRAAQTLVLIVAVGFASQAAAQSNRIALARGGRPDVSPPGAAAVQWATTQPVGPGWAGGGAQPVYGAATAGAGQISPRRGPGENPPLNPTVLRASLIAVQLPEQSRVGVNDLVTIIVREDKRFQSDAKLESDKEWKVESAFEKWFRLDPEHRLIPTDFPRGKPGVQFDFKNEYDGDGKFDRKDTLVTRIQARVIDVKPNGNLVLEARKRITVDEEIQNATLTGVCRSRDVTAQNTVLSTQVADLEINVQHEGAARDAARRGWLMRLFDLLRPI